MLRDRKVINNYSIRRRLWLFDGKGDSLAARGEGKGVMSGSPFMAGKLILEVGEIEYCECMLSADSIDLGCCGEE
jgi:hypothetical protein